MLRLILCSIVLFVLSVGCSRNSESPAIQLLNAIYSGDYVEIDRLTYGGLYDRISPRSTTRQITFYERFGGYAVKVEVRERLQGMVLFTLETPLISNERVFLIMYETNSDNRITSLTEVELVTFFGSRFEW